MSFKLFYLTKDKILYFNFYYLVISFLTSYLYKKSIAFLICLIVSLIKFKLLEFIMSTIRQSKYSHLIKMLIKHNYNHNNKNYSSIIWNIQFLVYLTTLLFLWSNSIIAIIIQNLNLFILILFGNITQNNINFFILMKIIKYLSLILTYLIITIANNYTFNSENMLFLLINNFYIFIFFLILIRSYLKKELKFVSMIDILIEKNNFTNELNKLSNIEYIKCIYDNFTIKSFSESVSNMIKYINCKDSKTELKIKNNSLLENGGGKPQHSIFDLINEIGTNDEENDKYLKYASCLIELGYRENYLISNEILNFNPCMFIKLSIDDKKKNIKTLPKSSKISSQKLSILFKSENNPKTLKDDIDQLIKDRLNTYVENDTEEEYIKLGLYYISKEELPNYEILSPKQNRSDEQVINNKINKTTERIANRTTYRTLKTQMPITFSQNTFKYKSNKNIIKDEDKKEDDQSINNLYVIYGKINKSYLSSHSHHNLSSLSSKSFCNSSSSIKKNNSILDFIELAFYKTKYYTYNNQIEISNPINNRSFKSIKNYTPEKNITNTEIKTINKTVEVEENSSIFSRKDSSDDDSSYFSSENEKSQIKRVLNKAKKNKNSNSSYNISLAINNKDKDEKSKTNSFYNNKLSVIKLNSDSLHRPMTNITNNISSSIFNSNNNIDIINEENEPIVKERSNQNMSRSPSIHNKSENKLINSKDHSIFEFSLEKKKKSKTSFIKLNIDRYDFSKTKARKTTSSDNLFMISNIKNILKHNKEDKQSKLVINGNEKKTFKSINSYILKTDTITNESPSILSPKKMISEYSNLLISKLSHEIRTSLISIKDISDKLLDKYSDNYEIYNSFNKIGSLSNIIIFLVYDLSDYLQNKTSPIIKSTMTIGELKDSIKSLCEAYMTLFNKENTVEIRYLIEEDLIMRSITTDEKKIKQILLNLLSNCIKNTIRGEIKVEIKKLKKQYSFKKTKSIVNDDFKDLRRNSLVKKNKFLNYNYASYNNSPIDKNIEDFDVIIEIKDEANGVPKIYYDYINADNSQRKHTFSNTNKSKGKILTNDLSNKFNSIKSKNSLKLPSFSEKLILSDKIKTQNYTCKSGLGNGFILSKKLSKELGFKLSCKYIFDKIEEGKIGGTRFSLKLKIDSSMENSNEAKDSYDVMDSNKKTLISSNNLNKKIKLSSNSSQVIKLCNFDSFNPKKKTTSKIFNEDIVVSNYSNKIERKLSRSHVKESSNFILEKLDTSKENKVTSKKGSKSISSSLASSRTVSKHSFILKFDSFDFNELDEYNSCNSLNVKKESKDEEIKENEEIKLNDKLPLLKKHNSRPEVKFNITNSLNKKNKLKPQHLTMNMQHVFTPSKQQSSAGRKSVIFINNKNLDLIDLENIEKIKERNSLSVMQARSPYKSNTSRVLPHLEGKANEIATIFNFNSPLNNSFHNDMLNSNHLPSEKLTEEYDNSSQVLKYKRNNTITKSGQYTLTIFDSNEKNITDNIQSSSNKNMRCNPHKPKSSINLLASPENIHNRFTSNFCLRTGKGSFNTCKEPNSFKFSPYIKIIQQLDQDLNQEHTHKTENLTRQLTRIDGETDDSKIELSKNSSGNLINFNDSNNYKNIDYYNNTSLVNNINQDSGNPLRKRSGLILKKCSLEVIKDEEVDSSKEDNFEYICVLVDDKAEIIGAEQRLLQKQLELLFGKEAKSKWKFVKLKDGFELVHQVYLDLSTKTNKIKLVLCDEMMDYMNGSESLNLLEKLYDKVGEKRIPFLFISAFTNNSYYDNVNKKNWEIQFLEKPLNTKGAKAIVEKYFSKYHKN